MVGSKLVVGSMLGALDALSREDKPRTVFRFEAQELANSFGEWCTPRYASTVIPTPRKMPRKCLLPSCTKMHTHNNAWCCPEHCQEHRRLMKGA